MYRIQKQTVVRCSLALVLVVTSVVVATAPAVAERECYDGQDPVGLDDCEDDDNLYTRNGESAEDMTEEITGRQVENGNAVETIATWTMLFSPVDDIARSAAAEDEKECPKWKDTCGPF
jgi:hypothetical protein